MTENLRIVLYSVLEVFGVVALAWWYGRRYRPNLESTVQLGMRVFIPCLSFAAILDSRIEPAQLGTAMLATAIQIGSGLLLGWVVLRWTRWRDCRELLLPIAFVNSANLPFPLLLANFGTEGLSIGVLCYTATNLLIYSAGILILHGGGRMREALREPVLWATAAAGLLRLFQVQVPEAVLRVPRLAGSAAVPLMLFLFGDALARTRMTAIAPSVLATALRYVSGGIGLLVTLTLLRPEGLLRKVLILYALLPSALINVVLTQKAGRDDQIVASAVLLATVVAAGFLPILLALIR